jgi:Villin headpiece domain
LASYAVVLAAVSFTQTVGVCKPLRRQSTLRRTRPSFASICCYLSAEDFTSCFRMPREAFQELLTILKPSLERDARRAKNGSGGLVQPDIRLAILLRILAGASYIDLQLVFRIARSTVFAMFNSTLCAILSTLKMSGVPVGDALKMRELAEAFRTSRVSPNPLWGCIGALDGIALPIQKPLDKYCPRHYFTCNGFYALLLCETRTRVPNLTSITLCI